MQKIVECEKCHRRIKIEGATSNEPETYLNVTCPYCDYSNKVPWSLGGSYTVTPSNR